jgi:hypothetical protein
MIQRRPSGSQLVPYRNPVDDKLVAQCLMEVRIYIISEARHKFMVNFSNHHLLEMKIFGNRALFEFRPR